jgi:RNA polymerase sigma factor (sigma-70 family)
LKQKLTKRLSTKKSEIEQLLNCESMQILKPIERKILLLRYGIESNKSLTLNEIGKIFNLTRQRISQIELKTIAKLKKYYQAKNNKSK